MIADLELLANTMKEWSSTSGDHHWLAHQAILELIEVKDREARLKGLHVDIIAQVDDAFTTVIITDAGQEHIDVQLDALFLKIGLLRTTVSQCLRVLGIKKPRRGEKFYVNAKPDEQESSSRIQELRELVARAKVR